MIRTEDRRSAAGRKGCKCLTVKRGFYAIFAGMRKIHRIALALLSALLLTIPFYRWGSGLVMMIAFVPLLFIEDHIASRKRESTGNPGANGHEFRRISTN